MAGYNLIFCDLSRLTDVNLMRDINSRSRIWFRYGLDAHMIMTITGTYGLRASMLSGSVVIFLAVAPDFVYGFPKTKIF